MSAKTFPTVGRRTQVFAAFAGLIALIAGLAFMSGPGNRADAAAGQTVVLGATSVQARPNCPSACTAFAIGNVIQAKIGNVRNVFRVPFVGKITRWNISLGKPVHDDWASFNENYGSPKAGLAVLRKLNRNGRVLYRLRSRSGIQGLGRYLGTTAKFTLGRPLNVNKGDYVALVVPTWAPALAQSTTTNGSWAVSRDRSTCAQAPNMQNSKPQLKVGSLVPYGCRFDGIATYRVRVESR